jgi:hypothetical protein
MREEVTSQELAARREALLADAPGAYRDSFTVHGEAAFWLERHGSEKTLVVVAPSDDPALEAFRGTLEPSRDGLARKSCAPTSENARALRRALPWLTPVPLGLATSAGFGDRLGIATPGHARALKRSGGGVAPIFAQQSIREMTRTRRTPEEVMTDATFGAFEAGWRDLVGADADHLKTTGDIDRCVAAGFTFYTIDPGEFVDDEAHDAPAERVREKLAALPWHELDSSERDLGQRYVGKTFDLGERKLVLEPEAVFRAAAKYGRAVAHVVRMYRHLASQGVDFELEVSVDETDTPTSCAEHAYIAAELKRLGVQWVSLAPRYVGQFEKGIDYIGDLEALREDLAGHAAVMKTFGPYKLSLHSGSDKFSVYPLINDLTDGLMHLKTAGTSYLEALRVIARVRPVLFREVGELARARFETDRASYHISAELHRVPNFSTLAEEELPALLEQDDARQVLHVTFGSGLDRFGPQIIAVLQEHEEAYYEGLARHFERHLRPFRRTP